MLIRDDMTAFGEESTGMESRDFILATGLFGANDDGYRCLAAFGDDLSLTDAPLLELDDLLPA